MTTQTLSSAAALAAQPAQPAQPVLGSTLLTAALSRHQDRREDVNKEREERVVGTGIKDVDEIVLAGGFRAGEISVVCDGCESNGGGGGIEKVREYRFFGFVSVFFWPTSGGFLSFCSWLACWACLSRKM